MSQPKNKQGRPARLSKEIIIDCALDQLDQGADQVSMNAIAKALGCAPMSLYKHFDNRLELLNAIIARVLGELDLEPPQEESWQNNIRFWMFGLHEHFSAHPKLLNLIHEERAPHDAEFFIPWLSVYAPLMQNLERAGFTGTTLIQLSRWLTQSVFCDIMLNGGRDEAIDGVDLAKNALKEIGPQETSAFKSLEEYSEQIDTNLFNFVVDQILAHLESQSA